MKKILAVLPVVSGAVGGGLYHQARETVAALSTSEYSVEPYNPWKQYDWESISAVHIFCANRETYDMALFVRSRNIPLVVSPVFFSLHPAWLIQAELLGTRLIQKISSGVVSSFFFLKEICRMADAILPNTDEEARLIAKICAISHERIRIVPNGVSPHFSHATPELFQQKYGMIEPILSVGNIGYVRKNMLNLLKAVAPLSHPVYIIGPIYHNAYGKACQEIAQNAPHINLLGPLDNSDPLLASAYAAARVFALPSALETPGIASLEAASTGATIVTTPYGGTRYYFGEGAYYCNPRSIRSIRTAIEQALRSPKASMADTILSRFTWEQVGRETAALYGDLLG
ncbi:glycosyltransferase family 4 protein [Chitinivibrio alkaliphilus]|uniref:GT1_YagM_like family glycosyltransferase n=1 Tax=Chitinivibrio alkaliphilus ACht1 TaxID=1313304 RepID=U7D4M7_9BACT|nr:glycosyltransferase family 4 protein [Chitinivibrio alkaliphilus]ERP31469.1 GT1_YagM_like family glycosyltransferase [Chitinivibrio alkaliphilus ACht1]